VVLAQAAGDAAAICEAASREVTMAVNISAAQLRDPGFVVSVENAVARIDTADLVLEITEREEIGRDPVVLQAMHTIAGMDVRFAIDDFGVGFSSISYLQDLPVRIIKVDASLSQNIDRDERACALLCSITMMGQALGLDVVVEGVERDSQLALVREAARAEYTQGYLLHRPMPLPQLLDVLRREHRGHASGHEGRAGAAGEVFAPSA
jgi:EAL domain-containing protein (putative c-di-GMP-specific phosphodiesterase class I)